MARRRATPAPLCTPADFARWLADAGAPRTLAYHEGLLVADRETDRGLATLADAALHASGALPASKRTGGADSRNGQTVQGPAGPRLVALTKQRLGEGRFEYRATKLPGRRRP